MTNAEYFRLDRTAIEITTVGEEQVEDWLSRPPIERLAAQEFLRETWYGHAATHARISRVLEIAQCP